MEPKDIKINLTRVHEYEINDLYESLIAQQAPATSDLRDDRIGDKYLTLSKKGSSYSVILMQGEKQSSAKVVKSFSFTDEQKARAKYYEIRNSIIDKMEKEIN